MKEIKEIKVAHILTCEDIDLRVRSSYLFYLLN